MKNYYSAEEGKTFVRKADNLDMGNELWLGDNDSIENYEECQIKSAAEDSNSQEQ